MNNSIIIFALSDSVRGLYLCDPSLRQLALSFKSRIKTMRQIDISTKKYPNTFVIVDDEDYQYINENWKWCKSSRGYAIRTMRVNKKKKSILMHRQILEKYNGNYDGLFTDHINGNTLDNRKSNLRICTISQNNCNRHGLNKYKGVSLGYKKYIISQIKINGKLYYLGTFKTELEAAQAYDKKALELHGEFAKINGV